MCAPLVSLPASYPDLIFAASGRLRWDGNEQMRISEEAVFRWVVIVGIAAVSIVALTLLTSSLWGALWGLVLVIVGGIHGYRWVARKWRES